VTDPSPSASSTLVRALGRWSLAAIILNIVIGASAFGVPGEIAALIGKYGPWAFLIGGLFMLTVGACFAEVASYFDQTGGPYLYARKAYGPFVGICIAWLMCLVRISSIAAICNLFVIYLGYFVAGADQGAIRVLLLSGLLFVFAALNVRGVRTGATASNMFAVLKIGALAIFALAGLFFLLIKQSPGTAIASVPITPASWLEAFILTVFSYGGIEVGLVATGEAKDARRDAPIAVFAVLGVAVLLYTLVQVAVTFTLPEAAHSKRAVAESAMVIFGSSGAVLMSVAAIVSICGYLMAAILTGPRILYALAEQRDLPGFLAAVHPRFRTPHVAIILFTIVIWMLTIWGTFRWAAFVSAVTRLLVYAAVCGAVFVFRRRPPRSPADGSVLNAVYQPWFTPLAAVLGIGFCGVLITRMGWAELAVLGGVAVISTATFIWSRAQTS
jgi:basic amino acid/polyamine antiporter, APA family